MGGGLVQAWVRLACRRREPFELVFGLLAQPLRRLVPGPQAEQRIQPAQACLGIARFEKAPGVSHHGVGAAGLGLGRNAGCAARRRVELARLDEEALGVPVRLALQRCARPRLDALRGLPRLGGVLGGLRLGGRAAGDQGRLASFSASARARMASRASISARR